MKKLVFYLVTFLIASTILYAQPAGEFPRRSPQEPKVTGEEGLQWLKEKSPEKYEKLIQLKDKNPQRFEREDMLQRLETEDPETYAMYKKLSELDGKTRELAEKYNAESSSIEKEKIKNEIQGVLNEAFDLKLAIGERRLNHLKEKLSELEKFAETRKSRKDEIIKKHLKNLLQQEDNLRW